MARSGNHRHPDLEEWIGRIETSTGAAGDVTIVQGDVALPINQKGDIVTHSGNESVRLGLPGSTAYVLRPTTAGTTYGLEWTDAAIIETTGSSTGNSYVLSKESASNYSLTEAFLVATTGTSVGSNYLLNKQVSGWGMQNTITVDTTGTTTGAYYVLEKLPAGTWQMTQLTTDIIDGL